MKRINIFSKGIRDGIPISLGYFAVSFALGIAAGNAGFSVFEAFITSLLNNASAGEYAAIALIDAGASYFEVGAMVLIANARYFLMSCSVSQKFSPETPFFHRLLIAFDLTDEIFAINITKPGYIDPTYAYGAILVALPGWSVGTALGVVAGNALPVFMVSALSVALFGMFIAIIIPPATRNRTVALCVLVSFALSFAANKLPFFSNIPSGVKTIVLTVVISLAAAIIKPIVRPEDGE